MYNDIKHDLHTIRLLESSDQQLNESAISALAGKIGSKIFPGLAVAQYGVESYELFRAGKLVDAIIAAAKAVGYSFPATAGILGTYDLLKLLWDNSDEIIELASNFTADTDSTADDSTELPPDADPDIAALQLELQNKGADIKIDGIPSEELYNLAVQYKLIQEQYIKGNVMSDSEEIRKYVNLVENPANAVAKVATSLSRFGSGAGKGAAAQAGVKQGSKVSTILPKSGTGAGRQATAATAVGGSVKSAIDKLKAGFNPDAAKKALGVGAVAGAGMMAQKGIDALSKPSQQDGSSAQPAASQTPSATTAKSTPVGGLSKDEEMELHALSSDLEYMARENPTSAADLNKMLDPYYKKYGK
jgi:peptidoglycan hydrolase-like protein with peptidoglycan-binding domain